MCYQNRTSLSATDTPANDTWPANDTKPRDQATRFARTPS